MAYKDGREPYFSWMLSNGYTVLHTAVIVVNTEAARILLEAGADINISSAYGSTPIFIAIRSSVFNHGKAGTYDMLLYLFSANPDLGNDIVPWLLKQDVFSSSRVYRIV